MIHNKLIENLTLLKIFIYKPNNEKNLHPDYHEINVVMTDGSTFKLDLHGERNDTLKLEIDPKSHPAWTGGKANLNDLKDKLQGSNASRD